MAPDLDSPEKIAKYLSEAFETADASCITRAIGDAARAQGMTELAKKAGFSRESLYRALRGEINPGFETIVRVLTAMDIRLSAKRRP